MTHRIYTAILILIASVTVLQSCKKKDAGVCYCDYVSGDKKEFNLKALERSEQIDSCFVLNKNANAFGGSCELE
ncbi:MAG: hypothetical protein R2800_03460 [Flavipsychrobacter sp.]